MGAFNDPQRAPLIGPVRRDAPKRFKVTLELNELETVQVHLKYSQIAIRCDGRPPPLEYSSHFSESPPQVTSESPPRVTSPSHLSGSPLRVTSPSHLSESPLRFTSPSHLSESSI